MFVICQNLLIYIRFYQKASCVIARIIVKVWWESYKVSILRYVLTDTAGVLENYVLMTVHDLQICVQIGLKVEAGDSPSKVLRPKND